MSSDPLSERRFWDSLANTAYLTDNNKAVIIVNKKLMYDLRAFVSDWDTADAD